MRWLAFAWIAAAGCGGDDDSGTSTYGEFTVHVVRDGVVPAFDTPVVFQDHAGRVLDTARTDAAGNATGIMVSDGMVTVVDLEAPKRLTTVVRVQLDAPLEIPIASVGGWGPEIGTLTIEAPPGPPPTDTQAYDVLLPCGNEWVQSLPATVPLHAGCEGSFPIVVVANGPPIALESPANGLAFATATVGLDRDVQLSTWSTQCAEVGLQAESTMSLSIGPRLGGQIFNYIPSHFCPSPTTGYQTADLGEGARVHASGYVNGQFPDGELSLLRDYDAMPTSVVVDDTVLLRGTIDDGSVSETGAGWSQANLDEADMIDVTVEWLVEPVEFVVWRFALPSEATRVVVPELPAELVTWDKLDAQFPILYVRYADASWIGGYYEVQSELPLLFEDGWSRRSVPSGGSIRSFKQTFQF